MKFHLFRLVATACLLVSAWIDVTEKDPVKLHNRDTWWMLCACYFVGAAIYEKVVEARRR